MKKKVFSIIIPVYKIRDQYLIECLISVVQQSLSEIEIILIDDGSPDNCGRICDEFAASDSRIKVIHQENQGVSVARNNGLKEATGDWILFVDGDDWLEPDACERLQRYVANRDWDILMFRAFREYTHRQVKMNYGLQTSQTYNTVCADTRELLYRRAMQTPSAIAVSAKTKVWPIYYSHNKVLRREFLIKNHILYPPGIQKSEDKVFTLRCFEKLSTLHYVDDLLYHYRIHPESTCRRYSENADVDRIKLARILEIIAARMDAEMGKLKNDAEYRLLKRDCYRFLFGIISDVLLLKYYHPDWPYSKATRKKEARAFLQTEPFRCSLKENSFSELSFKGKLKKLLLSCGFITHFCSALRIYRKVMNK